MIANRTLRILGKTVFAGQTLPDVPQEQADRLIKAGAVTVPVPKEETPVSEEPKVTAKKRTSRKKKATEEVS